MKNILVPTDFSACANNAMNVALDMADFFKANLHLYSQIDIPANWDTLSEAAKKQDPESLQRIHNTELLFQEWIEKATERNIKIKVNYSGGNFLKNVKAYLSPNKIDFVVMGSHGASGKNDYLIGTNTQKVVRLANIPVFVVKNDLSNYEINKVVFASDFSPSEQKAFKYMLDFVAPFKPEIHLVEVNTASWFTQPTILALELMKDFKALCTDLTCKTHFYKDWSVDSGVRHFSEKIGADLIVISNQNRHPVKRLFAGSNVEMLVNHAKVPVLSVDFPEA